MWMDRIVAEEEIVLELQIVHLLRGFDPGKIGLGLKYDLIKDWT